MIIYVGVVSGFPHMDVYYYASTKDEMETKGIRQLIYVQLLTDGKMEVTLRVWVVSWAGAVECGPKIDSGD